MGECGQTARAPAAEPADLRAAWQLARMRVASRDLGKLPSRLVDPPGLLTAGAWHDLFLACSCGIVERPDGLVPPAVDRLDHGLPRRHAHRPPAAEGGPRLEALVARPRGAPASAATPAQHPLATRSMRILPLVLRVSGAGRRSTRC